MIRRSCSFLGENAFFWYTSLCMEDTIKALQLQGAKLAQRYDLRIELLDKQ